MLIVKRKSGWYVDKTRTYQVIIDGKKVGDIKDGKELKLNLPVGKHTAQFKIDWCKSPELSFQILQGQHDVVVVCHPAFNGTFPLAAVFRAFFNPKDYITAYIESF